MADPTKITFGGVQLNKNEVARKTTKELTTFSGTKKEIYYIVEFKNGTKVSYRESNGGQISSTNDKKSYHETNIYNVMGLELVGSKDMDDITVDNSTVRWIDISEDKYGDCLSINKSKIANERISVLPQETLHHSERRPGAIMKNDKDSVDFDNRRSSNIFTVKNYN